jgi:hypothetical protein
VHRITLQKVISRVFRQSTAVNQPHIYNEKIVSSEKGTLTIPTKRGDIVLTGYIFDDKCLINNLAALSKLCNEGCAVTLDNETIIVSRDGENLWYGIKGSEDKKSYGEKKTSLASHALKNIFVLPTDHYK